MTARKMALCFFGGRLTSLNQTTIQNGPINVALAYSRPRNKMRPATLAKETLRR